MITIQGYLTVKLVRFGFDMAPDELEAELLGTGLIMTDAVTVDNEQAVKRALAGIIPELLIMPDIGEGGYAIQHDKDGLKAYYKILCYELGIPDLTQPQVVNKSFLW